MQEEKSKWVKYGSIFAIVIMVVSAVLVGLIGFGGGNDNETELLLSDIPGAQANFTFKNAKDGSTHVPEGALSINILKIYPDDATDKGLKQMLPGVDADKVMIAFYPSGAVEYYSLTENNNASITLVGKPQYDKHENHNILFISPAQRVIAGNPLILASFYNYVADNTLAKKVVDVLAGKSSGSTDFKDILAYADDTEIYDEIIVYKANTGSAYEKYYERSSSFINMTTFELGFELESIVLKPDAGMKAQLKSLSENATGSNKISITEDDNVLKTYIDSVDLEDFFTDREALYKIISDNTAQSAA